jgi:hypothetical protein
MASQQSSAPAPNIRYEDVTETTRHRWVEIPAGGVVPRYSANTGFVVFPMERSTMRKTFYKNGAFWKTEDLALDPTKPYFIPAFEPGVEVSVENTGTATATFKKVPVRSPQEDTPPSAPKPGSSA